MLHVGDAFDVLATLDECSVDALVTDGPYGYHFLGKAWDRPVKGRTRLDEARLFQEWTTRWAGLAFPALKPGAHVLSFGATRMVHRMASGLEDAGFEPRGCLAALHGAGFPKTPGILKPAWEPIVIMRKPCDGTEAANVERWGTGRLNIDDCRVPLADGDAVPINEYWRDRRPMPGFGDGSQTCRRTGRLRTGNGHPSTRQVYGEYAERDGQWEGSDKGRWPADVVHDGSDAVLRALPHTTSGRLESHHHRHGGEKSIFGIPPSPDSNWPGDEGSAGRFWYQAKPSTAEREAGLDDFPRNDRGKIDGMHPTIKSIELMRYLVRLATPAAGLVLDPFAGTGTTAIAAVLEGRRWLAVERDPFYAKLAQARLAFWERAHARKPGRTVAEVLGDTPRPKTPQEGRESVRQGDLWQ